jgi:hypothetical protein
VDGQESVRPVVGEVKARLKIGWRPDGLGRAPAGNLRTENGESKLAVWFARQIGLLFAVEKLLRERKAGPWLRAAMRFFAIMIYGFEQ